MRDEGVSSLPRRPSGRSWHVPRAEPQETCHLVERSSKQRQPHCRRWHLGAARGGRAETIGGSRGAKDTLATRDTPDVPEHRCGECEGIPARKDAYRWRTPFWSPALTAHMSHTSHTSTCDKPAMGGCERSQR